MYRFYSALVTETLLELGFVSGLNHIYYLLLICNVKIKAHV